jgi:hypothetical protein
MHLRLEHSCCSTFALSCCTSALSTATTSSALTATSIAPATESATTTCSSVLRSDGTTTTDSTFARSCSTALSTAATDGGRDKARGVSASASARYRPCEPYGGKRKPSGAPPQREHPHGGALLGSSPPISSPTRETNVVAASVPHI